MQRVINGINKSRFAATLALLGTKKYFLVCDSSFEFLNIKDLFDGGLPHIPFSAFSPNPVYEDVKIGVDMFRRSGADTIVAVGGGSAIDVAKCIKLFSAMDKNECYINQPYPTTVNVPLVAIPTTAGTGSESTKHAVIYYKGKKQSIATPVIIPDVALLEPSVLKTLPVFQKKCTMLDALCQGIESYWSVNSTEDSREYAGRAIRLIVENADAYVFDGDDDAAKAVMTGANYAGRAINITATTAAHAMSYKISSLYGLPHGYAVAICLPRVWKYMIEHPDECTDVRGREHMEKMFADIAAAMGKACPKCALAYLTELLEKFELDSPVGADKAEIDDLVSSVNPERLGNNPVALSTNVLHEMYSEIIKF